MERLFASRAAHVRQTLVTLLSRREAEWPVLNETKRRDDVFEQFHPSSEAAVPPMRAAICKDLRRV
jgi:hypothetical protein